MAFDIARCSSAGMTSNSRGSLANDLEELGLASSRFGLVGILWRGVEA